MFALLYARDYRKMVAMPVRPWQVTAAGVLSLLWIPLFWIATYAIYVEPFAAPPYFQSALQDMATSVALPTLFHLLVSVGLLVGERGIRTLVAIRAAVAMVMGILLAPEAEPLTVIEYAGVLCAVAAGVLVWTPGTGAFFRESRIWWAGLKTHRMEEKRVLKASKA